MENTMEIMEKNEDNIEKEETYGEVAEIMEPVEDLDEGLEPASNLTENIALAVGVLGLATGAGYLVMKGAKKIAKTKPVKRFRRWIGGWILKGLDDDVKSDVLPIEVVNETADGDQE